MRTGVAVALVAGVSGAVVVPLRRHDRFPSHWRSFLALDSKESRLAHFRARHNNTHAIEYSGDISVGGQPFSVLFDTGSDELIVPGAQCISNACAKHHTYDADKSNNSDDPDSESPREMHFGMGSIQGFERIDRICLGEGACALGLFIEAFSESDEPFLDARFDGVLGLSLKLRASADAHASMLEQMAHSKAIPHAQFSVFLSQALQSDASEIAFGGPNPERMTGQTTWAPLSEPGYWQFSLSDVRVGGKSITDCAKQGEALRNGSNVSSFFGRMCCKSLQEFETEERCQFWGNGSDATERSHYTDTGKVLQTYADGRVAIRLHDGCTQKIPRKWLSLSDGCRGDGTVQAVLDTGSSLMMGPEGLVNRILSSVGAQENCTLQNTDELPNVELVLPGGKALTLTQKDYMDTLVEQDGTYCWPHFLPMPDTAKGSVFVLGMPFLRTFYTTFDLAGKRVGFASPKQPEPKGSKHALRSVALRGVRPM